MEGEYGTIKQIVEFKRIEKRTTRQAGGTRSGWDRGRELPEEGCDRKCQGTVSTTNGQSTLRGCQTSSEKKTSDNILLTKDAPKKTTEKMKVR